MTVVLAIVFTSCSTTEPGEQKTTEGYLHVLQGKTSYTSEHEPDRCTFETLKILHATFDTFTTAETCNLDEDLSQLLKVQSALYHLEYQQAFDLLTEWRNSAQTADRSFVSLLVYFRFLAACVDSRAFEIPATFFDQVLNTLAGLSCPGAAYSKYVRLFSLYFESLSCLYKNAYVDALIPAFAALELHENSDPEIRFPYLLNDIRYQIGKIFSHEGDNRLGMNYFEGILRDTSFVSETMFNLSRANLFFLADLDHAFHIRDSMLNILISDTLNLSPRAKYSTNLILGYYYISHEDHHIGRTYYRNNLKLVSNPCNSLARATANYISDSYFQQSMLDSARTFNDLALHPTCRNAPAHKEQVWHWNRSNSNIALILCRTTQKVQDCVNASDAYHKQQAHLESHIELTDPHLSDATVFVAEDYLNHLFNVSAIFPQDSIHMEVLQKMQQAKSRALVRRLLNQEIERSRDSNKGYRHANEQLTTYLRQVNYFRSIRSPNDPIYRDLYVAYRNRLDQITDNQQTQEFTQRLDLGEVDIRRYLRENKTQLFNFLGTPSYYFALYISADTSGFYRLPRNHIDTMISHSMQTLRHERRHSSQLWDSLKTIKNLLLQNFPDEYFSNVIFLPDLNLTVFPFEVLNISNADTVRFMIEDYSVSYHYDYSQLVTQEPQSITIGNVAALSWSDAYTVNQGSTEYPELPGGYTESRALCEIVHDDCVLYSGVQLNRRNVESVFQADLVHLSTHAFSNEGNRLDNYLLIRDGTRAVKYYAYSIPLTNTRFKHVVLSACESGTGTYLPGEGVYSISREFIRVGCEVVTKSLWQIQDFKTSQIFVVYYHELFNGATIPDALRTAKLSLLQKYGRSLPPRIWAGLVVEGHPFLTLALREPEG